MRCAPEGTLHKTRRGMHVPTKVDIDIGVSTKVPKDREILRGR